MIMSLACLRDKHKRPVEAEASSCRADDRWTTLYRLHRRTVYGRCKRLLGDGAAAEDALHETFARALRHLTGTSDPEQERRWLLRVATNYCRNQLRDGRRRQDLLLLFDGGERGNESDTVVALDVAAYMTRSVPDEIGQVAWLSFVQEMEQHQVAAALGISRRTVVNRLATFRARARHRIAAYSPRSPASDPVRETGGG